MRWPRTPAGDDQFADSSTQRCCATGATSASAAPLRRALRRGRRGAHRGRRDRPEDVDSQGGGSSWTPGREEPAGRRVLHVAGRGLGRGRDHIRRDPASTSATRCAGSAALRGRASRRRLVGDREKFLLSKLDPTEVRAASASSGIGPNPAITRHMKACCSTEDGRHHPPRGRQHRLRHGGTNESSHPLGHRRPALGRAHRVRRARRPAGRCLAALGVSIWHNRALRALIAAQHGLAARLADDLPGAAVVRARDDRVGRADGCRARRRAAPVGLVGSLRAERSSAASAAAHTAGLRRGAGAADVLRAAAAARPASCRSHCCSCSCACRLLPRPPIYRRRTSSCRSWSAKTSVSSAGERGARGHPAGDRAPRAAHRRATDRTDRRHERAVPRRGDLPLRVRDGRRLRVGPAPHRAEPGLARPARRRALPLPGPAAAHRRAHFAPLEHVRPDAEPPSLLVLARDDFGSPPSPASSSPRSAPALSSAASWPFAWSPASSRSGSAPARCSC